MCLSLTAQSKQVRRPVSQCASIAYSALLAGNSYHRRYHASSQHDALSCKRTQQEPITNELTDLKAQHAYTAKSVMHCLFVNWKFSPTDMTESAWPPWLQLGAPSGGAVVLLRGQKSLAVVSHHHLCYTLDLRQDSPMLWSLASMSKMYSLAGSGYAKIGASVSPSLRWSNACCSFCVHCHRTPLAVSRFKDWGTCTPG